MVLLINLIPLMIVLVGGYLAYRKRKLWIAAATIFALFIYFKAQPSYMPKGDIQRSAIPEFTVPANAEIEDRNRKSQDRMEVRKQQEDQYREGPVFLKKEN